MKIRSINRNSHPLIAYLRDPDDLLDRLVPGGTKVTVYCFLDTSDLCLGYWKENPWLEDVCDDLIIVNKEIFDCFEVEKVPAFYYYVGNLEVHTIWGTATKDIVMRTITRYGEGV